MAKSANLILKASAVLASIALLAGCAGDSPQQGDPKESQAAPQVSETVTGPNGGVGVEGNAPTETNETSATPAVAAEYMRYGDESAPFEIEIYGDFLCPHCAAYAQDTKPLIVDEFVESGEASIVFRDFLVIDPTGGSMKLAIAARAAGLQGKYYEMHEVLMRHQDDLRNAEITPDLLAGYAEEAGVVDLQQFTADLNDPMLQTAVEADHVAGQSAGVRGTPWVFINGEHLEDVSFEGVQAYISA